jgi:hypothetical protein
VSGEQLVVLALLLAAFVAGWVARDVPPGRKQRRRAERRGGHVDEAGAWLERAVAAGVDPGRLAEALHELDRIDPELERAAGTKDLAYREFDRAVNQAHFLHRALTAGGDRPTPGTLAAVDELADASRAFRRLTAPDLGRMSDREIS